MDCARKREAGAPAFTWFQHRLPVDPQPRGFHNRHTGSHWHHWLHRQGPHTLPLVPACLCTLYTIIHSITYSSTNYPQSHRPSMFHLTTEAANGSHLYLVMLPAATFISPLECKARLSVSTCLLFGI